MSLGLGTLSVILNPWVCLDGDWRPPGYFVVDGLGHEGRSRQAQWAPLPVCLQRKDLTLACDAMHHSHIKDFVKSKPCSSEAARFDISDYPQKSRQAGVKRRPFCFCMLRGSSFRLLALTILRTLFLFL